MEQDLSLQTSVQGLGAELNGVLGSLVARIEALEGKPAAAAADHGNA